MTAEACGGDAVADQLDRALSGSRAGIEPANAVIAEPGLAARCPYPEIPRPANKWYAFGQGGLRCLPRFASTHHRMRSRSVIHFWMSSATWSEFVSIISIWPLPLMPLSGSETQSTLPPMAASAL
jgi:hypothetical protein